MLHTKFQASGPSGFKEEDFLIFFYVFQLFKPRPPGAEPLWILDFHLKKLGKGPLGSAFYSGEQFKASCLTFVPSVIKTDKISCIA